MLVQLDFLQRPYRGRSGKGQRKSGREGRYFLPDAHNQDVHSGNKAEYRELLHSALVLGNSWCGSHCARLGSLQAVDDAALANIGQTWKYSTYVISF